MLVDLGGDAGVAQLGVHGVGEVDDGGPAGHGHDVAIGGEDIDLVGEQIDLDVLEKFLGIACLLLHLQQALEPLGGMAWGGVAGFVQPMGGDAGLGDALHVLGADLYLDGATEGPEHHGVQRLIAIGLGDGDVILEASGHGLVQIVDDAQGAVTGVHLVDDDAKAVHIGDFVKAQVLVTHLVVDAVQVLLSAHHLRLDTLLTQALLDGELNLLDDFPAIAPRLLHGLFQDAVTHRVIGLEAQVLQLGAEGLHAQAFGDGGVDCQGFAGNPPLLFGAHDAQGAHVVQTVGQLDEDDADILHHGQDHLAEVFRLGLGLAAKFDLGEFADPIHQLGDFFAELVDQLFLGGGGVLNDIMQEGGNEGAAVHAQLAKDASHRQGVIDVGFAGEPGLALVGLGAEKIGPVDCLDLFGIEITLDEFAQVVNQKHRASKPLGSEGLLDLFLGYHGFLGMLFGCHLIHDFAGDLAFADFAQGDHGGLVVFPGNMGLFAGGQLAGALAGQQDQFKAVIHMIQTIFNGDSGHRFFAPINVILMRSWLILRLVPSVCQCIRSAFRFWQRLGGVCEAESAVLC